jgi:acyl carrier protein
MDEPFTLAADNDAGQAIGTDSMDSITIRVIKVLQEIRSEVTSPRPLSATVRLADIGFTSVDMVKVMLGVEAEFDLMIPQQEITPENFVSAETIATMLGRI